MKRLVFYLTFFSTTLLAQKEGNIWYFGNTSGLNFATNPPTVSTGSSMFTYDNSSAVCDQNGQLLFYTNGVTIWNKLHQVLSNGSGLLGNNSGGQSALIIPQPNSNLYYVFVVPNHGTGPLSYSIVDMTLASGNGAVTLKNQLLHPTTAEKLDSYYDCKNNRYWLVSHQYGNNNFYSYEINSSGLNLFPVISSVGNVHFGGSPNSSHDAMGQLTISPNGKLIALGQQFSSIIQIFDFSLNTGIILNPRSINFYSPWGLSFSRNSQMLYVTQWLTFDVSQINLTNPNSPGPAAVIGTVTGTTGIYGAGYLQLAPNDQIYIAKWDATHLSAIANPNLAGTACTFINNAINLGGVKSQAGVCRTVAVFKNPISLNSSLQCQDAIFSISDTSDISSVQWDFGNGLSSNLFSPTITLPVGTHQIQVLIQRCNQTDTLTTNITIPASSYSISSQVLCDYNATVNLSGPAIASCQWFFGDGSQQFGNSITHNYSSSGNYSLTAIVTDTTGCIDTITSNVQIPDMPLASFQAQTTPCFQLITINNNSQFSNNYTWFFGDGSTSNLTAPTHNYASNGMYTIQLIASDGNCADTTFQVITIDSNQLFVPSYTIDTCAKAVNFSWIGLAPDSCLWSFDSTNTSTLINPIYDIPNAGTYQITVISNPGSSCSDTSILLLDLSFLFIQEFPLSNSFSPNGDGINDYFLIKDYFNCSALEFTIFNRWGKKMFASKNKDDKWDGKNATEGTYMILVRSTNNTQHYTLTIFR